MLGPDLSLPLPRPMLLRVAHVPWKKRMNDMVSRTCRWPRDQTSCHLREGVEVEEWGSQMFSWEGTPPTHAPQTFLASRSNQAWPTQKEVVRCDGAETQSLAWAMLTLDR